jgi:hypothetical protein
VDGGSRALLNGTRLLGYLFKNKELSNGPSNMGGYLGKVIDNMPYTSKLTNGRAEAMLGVTNDLTSFIITGANADAWRVMLQHPGPLLKAAGAVTILSNYYSVGSYGKAW